ncbi:MAG: M28 family peptidase [Thermoprotei archaeon]|nr:M28 family peptidase [Thermoprotei archaeon]
MASVFDSVRADIEFLSRELYTGSEVNSGSLGEVREVERVKGLIESYFNVKARTLEVPLLTWRLKHLSLEPKPEAYATAPYVESSTVEAAWFKVEGDPTKPRAWKGFPEGRVAIVSEPPNPDDIKFAAIQAAEAGAQALIVESKVAPRIIVTNGYTGFNYNVGAPTPIPVIVVEEGYSSRLAPHSRVSVSIDATTMDGYGYTIEAEVPGSSEDFFIVGAHHDRWYGGFSDNVIGLAQAMVTARILGGHGLTVKLVSFTAEEYGAPGYASWYWAWGSRFYSKQLRESRVLESAALHINYDMASIPPLRVSGSPQYVGLVRSDSTERCCECAECDSFSLASTGVPTICMHSLWSPEARALYHTPRDAPDKSDLNVAAKAVVLAVKAALEGPQWDYMKGFLEESLGKGPLEARRLAYSINALAERLGWPQVYRELAPLALKAVHYGSYRGEDAELWAAWFPEVTIYLKLLRDLESGRAPQEVWIAGDEKVLYSLRGPGGKPLNAKALAQQFKNNMELLWASFEELQGRLLK